MPTLCRDCLTLTPAPPPERQGCAVCGSDRLTSHEELATLSIAHIDCDAFYAAIEKRDRPELADQPLIIGGGKRGVVSTACYIARRYGPQSAMPMYEALRLCPQAVVIKPDMAKYAAASRQVREVFEAVTPLVEPLSLDEAFLDLTGTDRLFKRPPAATLAWVSREIHRRVGITVSVGLSHNKFLAKMASDMDKPHGFAVIGKAETVDFLHDRPVGDIPGVGPAFVRALGSVGIVTMGDVQHHSEKEMADRFGDPGARLARFARGHDARTITPDRETKSISSETTFEVDMRGFDTLRDRLWPLCEKVARRCRAKGFAGQTVTLKLKTNRFRSLTRAQKLAQPTLLAEVIFRTGEALLKKELSRLDPKQAAFRLIGIGMSDLTDPAFADPPDLVDTGLERLKTTENVLDTLRQKFGDGAVRKGRGWTMDK